MINGHKISGNLYKSDWLEDKIQFVYGSMESSWETDISDRDNKYVIVNDPADNLPWFPKEFWQ